MANCTFRHGLPILKNQFRSLLNLLLHLLSKIVGSFLIICLKNFRRYILGFLYNKMQCCGSRIRCLFDPWIRDRFFSGSPIRISDPGSQIYIFVNDNFFLFLFKNKIVFNFVKFDATKKGGTTNFPPTLLFLCYIQCCGTGTGTVGTVTFCLVEPEPDP